MEWAERSQEFMMIVTINGVAKNFDNIDGNTPLLYVLRNDMELNGAKFGCGLGECGACTVLIEGKAARSCQIPIATCADKNIVTLEGLAGKNGNHLHPIQQAFIEEQAAQCGYCTNGMIMTLAALFQRNPQADEETIKNELAFNLCRCGSHIEVLRAAKRAKELIAAGAGQ